MDLLLIFISLMCTAIGLAVCETAKWMLSSSAWKRLAVIMIGTGLVTVGIVVIFGVFHLI